MYENGLPNFSYAALALDTQKQNKMWNKFVLKNGRCVARFSTNTERISFKNRIAIITGAGGALGRAYARALARQNCNLLLNDLPESNLGMKNVLRE